MDLVKAATCLAIIMSFLGCLCCVDGDRRNRRRKVKSRREMEKDISKVAEYGEWSDWSRCSRRCEQFRVRHCIKPDNCPSPVRKLFRACHSSSCKQRLLAVVPDVDDSGSNRGQPSGFRVLLHLQHYLYTDWGEWSPCSRDCYTRRIRTCRYPGLCGKNDVLEDWKLCYKEGDECEKMYMERSQNALLAGFNHTAEDIYEEIPAHPLDGLKCGVAEVSPDLSTRIIGGRRALKDSWPWQVLILNKFREPFCGGILLSSEWVLTAAHCVRRRLFVRVGEFDLSEMEGSEQEERVAHTFVYPDYDPVTVDNDMALLKLRTHFELNRHVRPVCLPSSGEELPLYARATILGWGKRRNDAQFGTDVLHQAEVPVVPPEECRTSYDDYYISDNMLCAGYDAGRVDSCAGDSGGPLLHKQEDGTWAVYGITSFGDGCGEKGRYGVYANVVNSIGWIRSIIKSQV